MKDYMKHLTILFLIVFIFGMVLFFSSCGIHEFSVHGEFSEAHMGELDFEGHAEDWTPTQKPNIILIPKENNKKSLSDLIAMEWC